MNLRRIQYHCSCGSCDECTGGNAKSYFEGLEQKPNIEQIVPVAGPSGKNSLTVASVTDGTTDTAGTDVAIGGTTIADLTTLGFDVTTKPTLKVTPDPADLNNTKVFIRESNGFLNFLASFKTKLLPSGSEGNILKYVSGLWTSAAPDWEKYNTTTTSPYVFTGASVGASVPLTVGEGLAYRFKHVVAVVDPSNSDKYMEGVVESYVGTLLTIKIKNVKGSGNTSGYNVMLTAPEYLPYVNDPANYGKFFYNNSGVIEMRTSIESVGDTKVWFSAIAPDTSWWLCDGTPKTITESPGLYNILVTQNGGAKSPFYVSGTTFNLPNATGATLVGVKASGVDSITLGEIKGANQYVLLGDNLPDICPYPIVDPGHEHAYVNYPNTGNIGDGGTSASSNKTPTAQSTSKIGTNVTIGNNSGNGGTAIDMRQRSLGMYLFIKAV